MIGALALDGGVYYFGQKPNKLVITRWDRPDLQNAALETDTKGFILTGGEGPIPYMEHRVQENEIPVIIVDEGTIAIADKLNGAFGRGKMHPDKVQQATSLVEKHLDLSHAVPVLTKSG
jgi:BioD-like phosphotransacetylase family protein